MLKGKISELMQQAQQVQENMKKAQEELAEVEVTGQAGGGLVEVVMNGRYEVRRVAVDPEVADDREMIEDLTAAAFNDAVNRVQEITREKMSEMTGGLPMPPGFNLP
jgi:DNA-binding YbaB/EbfC family protein